MNASQILFKAAQLIERDGGTLRWDSQSHCIVILPNNAVSKSKAVA